jgi:transcriptional regulator with XRE-family HTH domain
MELSFGERLRQHRERQNVALATIATQTKIKIGLLEGLERDDISHWPGGIFRRSYLRAYAEAIGLNADRIVREFAALHPDPTDEVSPVVAIAGSAPKRPPTRLTYLISSAISALPSRRQPAPRSILMSHDETHSASEVASVASVVSSDFSLAAPEPVALADGDLALSPAVEQQPLLDLGSENLPFHPRHPEPYGGEPSVDELADHYMAGRAALTGEAYVADCADDASSQVVAVADTAPGLEGSTPSFVAPRASLARREDIGAIADLCTRLGRVGDAREVLPVLEDATALLNAVGLILWTWDPRTRALRPALSHGYSSELLSQVPPVAPDSDNAIGSAFRSAETRIVNGDDLATGALAVPLLTPAGCTGVLAAEFRDSVEQHAWVRSVVTILAAQLSMLVGPPAALQAATA